MLIFFNFFIQKLKELKLWQNTFLLICLNLVAFSIIVYLKVSKQSAISAINLEVATYNQLSAEYTALETENAFLKNKHNPIEQALLLKLHPIEPIDLLTK